MSTSGSRVASRSGPASASGIGWSVVSASGTRTSSDWPPSHDAAVLPDARRPAEERPAHARRRQALAAPGALAAGDRARRQHAVAGRDGAHLGPDLLDGPDELVAEARAGREAEGLAGVEDVEVRAADAGHRHPHDRVGGRLDRGIGHLLHADVAACPGTSVPSSRPPVGPGRQDTRRRRPGPAPLRLASAAMAEAPHAALAERFRAEPGRAPRRASGWRPSSTEGMRCETTVARPHRGRADEPRSVGGTDTAQSPVELLLTSLATCQAITYRLWAAELGIALDRVEVEVTGDIDLRGFLGARRRRPRRLRAACDVRVTPRPAPRPRSATASSPRPSTATARCSTRSRVPIDRSSASSSRSSALVRARPARASAARGSMTRPTKKGPNSA